MSTRFSRELAPRDRAKLARRLADDVARMHGDRFRQRAVQHSKDGLDAFLANDLVPYLKAEQADLLAASAGSQPPARFGSRRRRLRRRLKEYRELIAVADRLRSDREPLAALTHADRLATLFDAHLVTKDQDLLSASRVRNDDDSASQLRVTLATELDELVSHDHERIAKAIATARLAGTEDPANRIAACDLAVAAVSQHAVVMSTVAYPMVRHLLLDDRERVRLRGLTADLRQADRAMRHLNRLLRGAARENPRDEELMWQIVAEAWRRHVADEEPLIRELAPLLAPELASSLMASLRGPFRHALTRPHPALLHAGWPTRLAISAQYRIDRWRDVLDNRTS